MINTRQPNLTVQGKAGWCLSFTQDVWGTPHLYPKAIDAWNNSGADNHPNEQPPSDVSVVCYWTYTEGGVQYGHIATSVPGKGVYSSPFNSLYGSQWFASVGAVTNRINQIAGANSRYLGWSESLSGVKLVTQGANNVAVVDTLKSMYWRLLGREADQDGITHHTASAAKNGWEFVYNDLKNSAEGQNDWTRRNPDRVASLEAGIQARDVRIQELQTALANEQSKPPREVIKEVEKIVEKPIEVIKEVPVYTHDQATADTVQATSKTVNSIKGMLVNFIGYVKGKLGK